MFETNDIIKDYIDELKCWISFEKTFYEVDAYSICAMEREIKVLEKEFF